MKMIEKRLRLITNRGVLDMYPFLIALVLLNAPIKNEKLEKFMLEICKEERDCLIDESNKRIYIK